MRRVIDYSSRFEYQIDCTNEPKCEYNTILWDPYIHHSGQKGDNRIAGHSHHQAEAVTIIYIRLYTRMFTVM